MSSRGTVRTWLVDEGWGVIDSPDTPGGCWAHFSQLAMTGFRSLTPGQLVELEWEAPGQDGYPYRAVRVWTGAPYDVAPHEEGESAAYRSRLTLTWDEDPATDAVRELRSGGKDQQPSPAPREKLLETASLEVARLVRRTDEQDEVVRAVGDTLRDVKKAVDQHTETLAAIQQTLAQQRETLAQHGELLAEILRRLSSIAG